MPNGWRTIKIVSTQNSTSRSTRERNGWILLARKIKACTAERRWMRNPVWPSSCVTPAGTSFDVQNEWEENTHTHTPYTEVGHNTSTVKGLNRWSLPLKLRKTTDSLSHNPFLISRTYMNKAVFQCTTVVMLGYDWWLCMVINISVPVDPGSSVGTS